MTLSDDEIEKQIEKTVYKLEKFYKIYNIFYKIRTFFQKTKEFFVKNLVPFLIIYTILLYFLFRSL